jgi:hypothetical protein
MSAIPPLLQLAAGRKVRPRKVPVVQPKEGILHFGVAKLLREHCRSSWQWTHVVMAKSAIRTATKLKNMEQRRGWPYFVLVPPGGQIHCLELKRIGERLSEDQRDFQMWCLVHRVPFVVATLSTKYSSCSIPGVP